jgi:hypothetical protein
MKVKSEGSSSLIRYAGVSTLFRVSDRVSQTTLYRRRSANFGSNRVGTLRIRRIQRISKLILQNRLCVFEIGILGKTTKRFQEDRYQTPWHIRLNFIEYFKLYNHNGGIKLINRFAISSSSVGIPHSYTVESETVPKIGSFNILHHVPNGL